MNFIYFDGVNGEVFYGDGNYKRKNRFEGLEWEGMYLVGDD